MALDDYDHLIVGASNQYNVDPQLLKAVMSVESDGNPRAYNRSSGATGLMQFIPSTAAEQGVLPTDPISSIYGGAAYLSELLNKYGSVDAALQHYSGGGGAPYANKVVTAYKAVSPPIAVGPGTGETKVQPAAAPAVGPASSASGPATDTDPDSPTTGAPTFRNFAPPPAPDRPAISDVPQGRQEHLASAENMSSTASSPAAPSAPTVLSPAEQQLIGGAPPKPAAAPAPATPGTPPADATVLSPAERQLIGAPPPPEPAPAPAAPAPPPGPPVPNAGPQVPQVALLRPGAEGYTGPVSENAQAQIDQLQGPPPSSPPGGVPAITQENLDALAGFSHGSREAVNPFLEWGSNLLNRVASGTGLPIATDRAANDAASNAAFNAQYANNPIATGAATGARVGLPFVIGGALGRGTQLGLEAANLPRVASYLSGGGLPNARGIWGLGNRLASGAVTGGYQGLATGGPWGAVTGAGIGLGLAPIGAGLQAAENRIAPEGVAASQIYQQMIRDGMTPADAAAQLQRMGPLATLADIPNAVPARNLGTLAEGVANAPGPGQQIVAENIGPRMQGQAGRLTQAVMRATGNPQSAFQEAEDLVAQQRQAARPLYDNAFNNTPIRMQASAQLAPYIDTPIGQRALQDGIANAQAEAVRAGQPFSLADYGVVQNPDGSLAIQPWNASLKTYDAIKRGYDQLAESLRDPVTLRINRSGTVPTPGGANISANTVIGMRDDVARILRQNYPEYAAALDAWSGPAQSLDALRMGQNVLNQDAEQTAQAVSKFTPQQQEMYQAGIAQTLRDRILRMSGQATEAGAGMTPPNAVRAIFANGLMRERIAAGFGGEANPAFQQFANDMENEAAFANASRYTSGSPTAHRTEAIQLAQGGGSGLNLVRPVVHLVTGNPLAAGADVAHQVGGQVVANALAPSERVNQALGNFLFNPQSQGQIMNMLAARPGPTARQIVMSPWSQAAAQAALESRQRAAAP